MLTLWSVLPLNTASRLITEIHFLFRVSRILLLSWPGVAVERANVILVVGVAPVVSKSNLRLVLCSCSLMECLVNIVV